GGNNMALSPTALLRIGEAVRQGGTWRRRRIVGQDWIEASWTARTVSPWSGDAYGYGWFLRERDGRGFAYGRGYGGQLLYVAPDLDLTVVLISDPTRPARSGGYIDVLHDLVTEAIVPAVAQG
ncbi:MAG: 6-aminohexanoate hydrolase, partial [Alphaproteobacteria bacterium]